MTDYMNGGSSNVCQAYYRIVNSIICQPYTVHVAVVNMTGSHVVDVYRWAAWKPITNTCRSDNSIPSAW